MIVKVTEIGSCANGSIRHIIWIMKKHSKTKFAILGLLTIKPLSGYDIKRLINNSIAYFWSESNGQIYPTLNQLTKEKLIVVSTNQFAGKKMRITYAITALGRLELQKWMREKDEKSVHRDEKLLKLFFGKNISKKECIQLLKNREKKQIENLKEYESILKSLQEEADSPHHVYWVLTVKNGISSAEAEIKWCRGSIKTLKSNKKDGNLCIR